MGFHKMPRGLFAVYGAEAVQFLNGLITNDIAKLEHGEMMKAAFPTVKGRVFALVRVKRIGDKYFFETEESTREKVLENLSRFIMAGDFKVDDLSEKYKFYRFFGEFEGAKDFGGVSIVFEDDIFIAAENVKELEAKLADGVEISDELYEILRIEKGIPKYGVDMDEDTVVSELNIDGLISYKKGCYIGQEVIARIHFRGKPAKQLRGLVFEDDDHPDTEAPTLGKKEGGESVPSAVAVGLSWELKSMDEKNAGHITSVAFSPKLERTIALGYVRSAFLDDGIELKIASKKARVSGLPLF